MREILLNTAAAILLVFSGAISFGADYALVVGVNQSPQYKPNGAALKILAGAEADGRDFAKLLQTAYHFPKQNIDDSLIGPAATHEAIEDKFKKLETLLGPNDQFVFYFAGHGTQVDDAYPYPPPYDEPDKYDEALCTSNACVFDNMAKNLIVDDELAVWLRRLPASRISVVVDSCHSGTATIGTGAGKIESRSLPNLTLAKGPLPPPGVKPVWGDLMRMGKGRAKTVIAIFACDAKQSAIERSFAGLSSPGDVRGQFTKTLIDNLQAGGPNMPTKQLTKKVKDDLQTEAKRLAPAAPIPNAWRIAINQNPSFEANDGGNSPLILPAAIANPPVAQQAK